MLLFSCRLYAVGDRVICRVWTAHRSCWWYPASFISAMQYRTRKRRFSNDWSFRYEHEWIWQDTKLWWTGVCAVWRLTIIPIDSCIYHPCSSRVKVCIHRAWSCRVTRGLIASILMIPNSLVKSWRWSHPSTSSNYKTHSPTCTSIARRITGRKSPRPSEDCQTTLTIGTPPSILRTVFYSVALCMYTSSYFGIQFCADCCLLCIQILLLNSTYAVIDVWMYVHMCKYKVGHMSSTRHRHLSLSATTAFTVSVYIYRRVVLCTVRLILPRLLPSFERTDNISNGKESLWISGLGLVDPSLLQLYWVNSNRYVTPCIRYLSRPHWLCYILMYYSSRNYPCHSIHMYIWFNMYSLFPWSRSCSW